MKKILISGLIFSVLLLVSGCTTQDEAVNQEANEPISNVENKVPESNQIENNQKEVDLEAMDNDSDSDSEVSEVMGIEALDRLSQFELPLVGENVFDPKVIQIGDSIKGFKLIGIDYSEASEQYPFDTVVASFDGEITIKGAITSIPTDGDYPSLVALTVNEEYINSLPVSHHDLRISLNNKLYLLINNPEEIIEDLGIGPGDTLDNVEIKIKDYVYVYIPSDSTNVATYVSE